MNPTQRNEALKKWTAIKSSLDTRKSDFVTTFPVSALPANYARIVADAAQILEVPADFLALSILTVTATLIGNQLRPSANESWSEPCVLYSGLIGGSGDGKTRSMNFAMAPLFNKEKQFRREAKEARETAEPGKTVRTRRYVINKITNETILKRLLANPHGLLYYQDELTSWIDTLNQYRKGDDEQFWLTAFDGQPFLIDRARSDEFGEEFIPRVCVSVLGGATYSALAKFADEKRSENGFLFRLNFAFAPTRSEAKRFKRRGAVADITSAKQDYVDYCQKLYSLKREYERRVFESDEAEPDLLPLSARAEDIWEAFYNKMQALSARLKNESRIQNAAEISIIERVISQTLRVSCIIEAMKWASGESSLELIAESSMASAVQIGEYFYRSAMRVQSELAGYKLELLNTAGTNKQRYHFGDWSAIYRTPEERKEGLAADELIKRIQKLFPDMSVSSCYNYFNRYLEPVKMSIWRPKDSLSAANPTNPTAPAKE